MSVAHNHRTTAARKVYAAPKLQRFGGIGALTAGGVGSVQESMSAMGMGCGNAHKKYC